MIFHGNVLNVVYQIFPQASSSPSSVTTLKRQLAPHDPAAVPRAPFSLAPLPLAASSPTKPDDLLIKTINNLRTVEINFQSLNAKREEFWWLLEATKPDIIYGCETWLNPNKTYVELFPPGYDLYRRDGKDGYGGVLLAIHSSLNSHQLNIKTDTEFIAAKIINKNQPIIVGALYRLPNKQQ